MSVADFEFLLSQCKNSSQFNVMRLYLSCLKEYYEKCMLVAEDESDTLKGYTSDEKRHWEVIHRAEKELARLKVKQMEQRLFSQ
jgi:hypothetical protein